MSSILEHTKSLKEQGDAILTAYLTKVRQLDEYHKIRRFILNSIDESNVKPPKQLYSEYHQYCIKNFSN